MKTIGIVGGSISGNKGAETMVTAVVRSLRARCGDVRFVIFTPYARADEPLKGRYGDAVVIDGGPVAVALRFLPACLCGLLRRMGLGMFPLGAALRELARCDLVVDVAGISFADGRLMFVPYNVLTILPAMLLGIPVVKLSQAMGPFSGLLVRAAAKFMLPRCRLVVARGAHTAANLRSIGLSGFLECPDAAFCLNDYADMRLLDEPLAELTRFGTPSRPLVGITPSSVVLRSCRRTGVDYVGIHAEFCRRLVGLGYRVLLLPHSMRPGAATPSNNDLPVVEALAGRLAGQAEVAAVRRDLDSIDLRRLIGLCEFLLTSRFHGMIAALSMNVPVMVCGWGHKYFEVLDRFGQRQYAFDYRELSLERMVETFDRLARNASAVRQAIAAELPEVMRQARQQMDAAAAVLLGQPGRPAGREGGRRDSSADGASPGASGGPTA